MATKVYPPKSGRVVGVLVGWQVGWQLKRPPIATVQVTQKEEGRPISGSFDVALSIPDAIRAKPMLDEGRALSMLVYGDLLCAERVYSVDSLSMKTVWAGMFEDRLVDVTHVEIDELPSAWVWLGD